MTIRDQDQMDFFNATIAQSLISGSCDWGRMLEILKLWLGLICYSLLLFLLSYINGADCINECYYGIYGFVLLLKNQLNITLCQLVNLTEKTKLKEICIYVNLEK